jgi:hypothetical protein
MRSRTIGSRTAVTFRKRRSFGRRRGRRPVRSFGAVGGGAARSRGGEGAGPGRGRGRGGAAGSLGGAAAGANTDAPGRAPAGASGREGRSDEGAGSGAGTWTLRGSRRGLVPLTGGRRYAALRTGRAMVADRSPTLYVGRTPVIPTDRRGSHPGSVCAQRRHAVLSAHRSSRVRGRRAPGRGTRSSCSSARGSAPGRRGTRGRGGRRSGHSAPRCGPSRGWSP